MFRKAILPGVAMFATFTFATNAQNTPPTQGTGQQTPTAEQQTQQTDTGMKAEKKAGQKSKKQTAESKQKMSRSRMAANLLDHTQQARQAIDNQNKSEATKHINQALSSYNKLVQNVPEAEQKLIPVYAEFEQAAIIGPIAKERMAAGQGQTAQRGREQTQTGQKQSGQQTEQQQPQTGEQKQGQQQQTRARTAGAAVQDLEAEYTAIYMDASQAQTHLQAAKTAINAGEWDKADAALGAVIGAVNVVSVESDMPLMRARQNLALARAAAEQKRWNEVQAPLNEAAEALNNYAAMGGKNAQTAKQLSSDIKQRSETVSTDNKGFTDTIANWWDEVTDFVTPGNEKG